MNDKKIPYWIGASGVAMMFVHVTGVLGDLYSRAIWFDVAPHFLSGIVTGSVVLFILHRFPQKNPFTFYILGVGAVLVGWEIFELAVGLYIEPNYILDTTVDLLMGSAGAWVVSASVGSPALAPVKAHKDT